MKKFIALTAVLGLYCTFGAKKAYAWSSATHEDIVSKALKLLEKEKKTRQSAFFRNYHSQILKGCTEPDNEDDPDCGLGSHYYSAYNPKGKELSQVNGYYQNRLGKFARSARTMLEENYTSALSLYKNGNIETAMRFLGRSAHFISDMGCTVHATNMRYLPKPGNVHYAFEKHVSTTCVKQTAENLDKRLTKFYSKDDFQEACNRFVKYSGKFGDAISSLDPLTFDKVSSNTLPATQQNVASLFLKFYDDCNSEKSNYLKDRKLYTIKNQASGLALTASPKGLTLETPDKSPAQKFEVCLLENGTFSIKTNDGKFIRSDLKGYDSADKIARPSVFRAAALGQKVFRIHSVSSKSEKALTNTKSGKLTFTDFDPSVPTQQWLFL